MCSRHTWKRNERLGYYTFRCDHVNKIKVKGEWNQILGRNKGGHGTQKLYMTMMQNKGNNGITPG